jgi:hypothetical protein
MPLEPLRTDCQRSNCEREVGEWVKVVNPPLPGRLNPRPAPHRLGRWRLEPGLIFEATDESDCARRPITAVGDGRGRELGSCPDAGTRPKGRSMPIVQRGSWRSASSTSSITALVDSRTLANVADLGRQGETPPNALSSEIGVVDYKARAANVPVLLVDPTSTSKGCPARGVIDAKSRPNQAPPSARRWPLWPR